MATNDEVMFNLQVRMGRRWVPHFMSMLRYMETLGNMGGSREVGIYSDGDGDFHPHFMPNRLDASLDWDVEPKTDRDGDRLYDAG